MRIKLVKIGNSYGIRLPKNVIKDCDFSGEIDLTVHNKNAVLSAVTDKRTAWRQLFRDGMAQKPVQGEGEWEW